MHFQVDPQIHTTGVFLSDWTLSSVYLKNEANFPWLILVPRQENVQEIYQLSDTNRQILMNELTELSIIVQELFNPDKLNIGALGNIISQLHIHVVARFKTDKMWPHSIWQPFISIPYKPKELMMLCSRLKKRITV